MHATSSPRLGTLCFTWAGPRGPISRESVHQRPLGSLHQKQTIATSMTSPSSHQGFKQPRAALWMERQPATSIYTRVAQHKAQQLTLGGTADLGVGVGRRVTAILQVGDYPRKALFSSSSQSTKCQHTLSKLRSVPGDSGFCIYIPHHLIHRGQNHVLPIMLSQYLARPAQNGPSWDCNTHSTKQNSRNSPPSPPLVLSPSRQGASMVSRGATYSPNLTTPLLS